VKATEAKLLSFLQKSRQFFMAFAEINDLKGLCKDVTGLGRWGNGDVEAGLKSIDA
jgi:predicted transport protein